jgi:hypothetical protein
VRDDVRKNKTTDRDEDDTEPLRRWHRDRPPTGSCESTVEPANNIGAPHQVTRPPSADARSSAASRSMILHRVTELHSRGFQRVPVDGLRVIGRESEPQPVASEPRYDVEMEVRHLLAGHFAIREEKIHTFASEVTPSLRGRDAVRRLKETRGRAAIQLREAGDVEQRHDERMARCYRLSVHERRAEIVAVNE